MRCFKSTNIPYLVIAFPYALLVISALLTGCETKPKKLNTPDGVIHSHTHHHYYVPSPTPAPYDGPTTPPYDKSTAPPTRLLPPFEAIPHPSVEELPIPQPEPELIPSPEPLPPQGNPPAPPPAEGEPLDYTPEEDYPSPTPIVKQQLKSVLKHRLPIGSPLIEDAYSPLLPASVISIHDADTMIVKIEFSPLLTYGPISIRANGYDSWEINRVRKTEPFKTFTNEQWLAEIEKGKLAKDFLISLLTKGQLLIRLEPDDGAYSRLLASLFIKTREGRLLNVAEQMIDNGHDRNHPLTPMVE